jgi:hypothetical protein
MGSFPYEDAPYNENLWFPNSTLARGYISGIAETPEHVQSPYNYADVICPQTVIRVPKNSIKKDSPNAGIKRDYPGNTLVR